MSITMVGRRQKIKKKTKNKKHWLKHPKAVPKNEIWTKTSMIQNFIFRILFLKILLRACNAFIFVPTFQWTSSEFFLIFRFSSRKSQSQQKLAKKITHFTIQFRSKNLIHFTNLNSLEIENNMLPQHSQKPFWLYKFSNKHVPVWCQKKTFGLHHFLTPKNYILEAFWKQMSVYFCISP